ncbi:MAG: hypothetical protein ACI4NI_04960 [Candidatus Ornithospirochaeta sp.]
MKKITTTLIVLALTVLVASPLFASGATEKGTNFKELDLNTASLKDMESAWTYSVESYNSQRTSLRGAMDEAIEKRDVEDYLELRSLYNSLEYPMITKDQTETLTERILNTENQEEKDEIASFLYENSAWYHPTLTFEYSVTNGNYSRSYRKSFSAVPGTTVTAPEVKGDGVFLGWSADGENVTYESGDEISMPYSDTVLYAIFSTGITFKDSVSGNDSYTEGTEASVPNVETGDPNLVFLGWYDEYGKKVDGDTVTVENGKSKEYIALYRGVEIGDASIRYYEDGKIPSSTQVVLSFPIKNTGNTALRNLKVSLGGEEVKVLSSSLKATLIGDESSLNASFLVYVEGEKGEEKVFTATVEDASGNVWTKDFTLTIQ